jgi:hypothetical protein
MKLMLLILGCLFSVYAAAAGIYKCTGGDGTTEYRSTPCKTGRSNVEINIKTGTATNLDDKNKQQALAQKEQQAAQEKQALEQEQVLKKQVDANRDVMNESAKNQSLIKNNPDKFSAYAIPPYVPGKLSALVKIHQSRLADIERLRRLSAEKALASGQCGRVESVELHSKSTQDALMFLINCSSGQSFYFREQDLTQ